MSPVDPITVEVIRYDLISAAEEIKKVFKRTATLAILYEINDFGISLYDEQLRLMADAPGLPLFSGTLDYCIRSCLCQLGSEGFMPGDAVITNYPFDTGSQTIDVAIVSPIIHQGETLGYAALKGHMGDNAAIDPYPTYTEDIFQEGIVFPGLKLYRAGKLDESVLRLIQFNSRIPYATGANFLAGVSALRAGIERVLQVIQKYGTRTFRAALDQIISHGERVARKAIEQIAQGTWGATDYLDNNGIDKVPVKIEVRVSVEGSGIVVDLSGSAPQQRGPVNLPYPGTVSAARYALKALTTPLMPSNAGHFYPLQVIAPEGSLFHPKPPAATFLYAWAGFRLIELIPKALASAIPKQVPAGSGGDICGVLLAYYDYESGRGEQAGGPEGHGTGAKYDCDGESGLMHDGESGCCNAPVEVMENRAPVLIDRYELRQDSGGPGEFRGGLGLRKDHRTLTQVSMISIAEKTVATASVPWGLAGGNPGKNNRVVLFPDSEREQVEGKYRAQLEPDTVVSQQTGGGGGYGNPLTRPAEKVVEDVRDAYVSVQSARSDYGVVVRSNEDGVFTLDCDETGKLRNSRMLTSPEPPV
jgi:N-methylhydantoinase B